MARRRRLTAENATGERFLVRSSGGALLGFRARWVVGSIADATGSKLMQTRTERYCFRGNMKRSVCFSAIRRIGKSDVQQRTAASRSGKVVLPAAELGDIAARRRCNRRCQSRLSSYKGVSLYFQKEFLKVRETSLKNKKGAFLRVAALCCLTFTNTRDQVL